MAEPQKLEVIENDDFEEDEPEFGDGDEYEDEPQKLVIIYADSVEIVL